MVDLDAHGSMEVLIATLRRAEAPALLDLLELDAAVSEIAVSAQRLDATVREIAGDSAQLAADPNLASQQRLRALAAFTLTASDAVAAHAAALAELKRGLDGWKLGEVG